MFIHDYEAQSDTVVGKIGDVDTLLLQLPKHYAIERTENTRHLTVTVREGKVVKLTRSIPLCDNPFALLRLKALVNDLRALLSPLDAQGRATFQEAS